MYFFFFFFSSRRRHTRSDRDWSSDVCSSDLNHHASLWPGAAGALQDAGGPAASAGGEDPPGGGVLGRATGGVPVFHRYDDDRPADHPGLLRPVSHRDRFPEQQAGVRVLDVSGAERPEHRADHAPVPVVADAAAVAVLGGAAPGDLRGVAQTAGVSDAGAAKRLLADPVCEFARFGSNLPILPKRGDAATGRVVGPWAAVSWPLNYRREKTLQ